MKKYLPKRFVISAIIINLLLFSCEIDYGDINFQAELKSTPDIVVQDFLRRIYRDNILVLELRAKESRTYASDSKQEMEDITFIEYDVMENIINEGRANYATFFTDTEDVELREDIYIYSRKEQAVIEGEYFYWTSSGKQISSLPSEIVRIVKETSSGKDIIEGKGFLADMRYRTVSFTEGVSGSIEDIESITEGMANDADE